MPNQPNKPVVVHRKPHQGLVHIPYPDLPLPRILKKDQSPKPPVAKPFKPKELPPKPVVGPKLGKIGVGKTTTEEVEYELPNTDSTDDGEKIKDMGKFVVEPIDWDA